MPRHLLVLCLGLLAAAPLAAEPASAGANANAKILVHLAAPTQKAACTRATARPACNQINATGQLYPTRYFAYALVVDAAAWAGVGAMEFGIDYDGAPHSGVDVYEWHLCADAETPSAGWPAAVTGNRIAWNSANPGQCQRWEPGGPGNGVVAVAGYFYCAAYTPDTLRITPNPSNQEAAVTDCGGVTDHLFDPEACGPQSTALGSAAFGGGVGYNPCGYLVRQFDCGNIGPSTVPAGAMGVNYGLSSYGVCRAQAWRVTGNAVVVGRDDESFVALNIGAAGEFTLEHSCIMDFDAVSTCCKTVSVLDPVVVQPSTWSSIKAMYR